MTVEETREGDVHFKISFKRKTKGIIHIWFKSVSTLKMYVRRDREVDKRARTAYLQKKTIEDEAKSY